MRNFIILCVVSIVAAVSAGCDVQSGITKKSVKKYIPTPTPEMAAKKVEEPIDPADIVNAETAEIGPLIAVNTDEEAKKGIACDKFERVMINGHNKEVDIKGVCSRITINGLNNKIKMTAAAEIVINGNENVIEHSKYANGNRPVITDNGSANTVTKISDVAAEDPQP